jgi:hypothetical protein
MVIDGGDKERVNKRDVALLTNYFLAGVTMPGKDLWVNLSPYENDRIVSDVLSQTDLGKDLLAQDYVLKQFVSSLTCPKGVTGKGFWQETLEKVAAELGTTNVPVNTFNKVWIVPGEAEVAEQGTTVLISYAHLNVMLEQDYLALSKANADTASETGAASEVAAKVNTITENTVREKILPIIEKEVNMGKSFAALRQIYHALILSVWFRQKMIDSFYRHYMDTARSRGIEISEKDAKAKIYGLYSEAFTKGVYDFMAKEKDLGTGKTISRHYFSGGMAMKPEKMLSAFSVYDNREAYDDAKKYVIAHARDGKLTEADVRLDVAQSKVTASAVATVSVSADAKSLVKNFSDLEIGDVSTAEILAAMQPVVSNSSFWDVAKARVKEQLQTEFRDDAKKQNEEYGKRMVALLKKEVYDQQFKTLHESYMQGDREAMRNHPLVKLLTTMYRDHGGYAHIQGLAGIGAIDADLDVNLAAMQQSMIDMFYRQRGADIVALGSAGSVKNDYDTSSIAAVDSEMYLLEFLDFAKDVFGTDDTEKLMDHNPYVHTYMYDEFGEYARVFWRQESALAYASVLMDNGGIDSSAWKMLEQDMREITDDSQRESQKKVMEYALELYKNAQKSIGMHIEVSGERNAMLIARRKAIADLIAFKKEHAAEITYRDGPEGRGMYIDDHALSLLAAQLIGAVQLLSPDAYRAIGSQELVVHNEQRLKNDKNKEGYRFRATPSFMRRIQDSMVENIGKYFHQTEHGGIKGFLKGSKYLYRMANAASLAGVAGSDLFREYVNSMYRFKKSNASLNEVWSEVKKPENFADMKAMQAVLARMKTGEMFDVMSAFADERVAWRKRISDVDSLSDKDISDLEAFVKFDGDVARSDDPALDAIAKMMSDLAEFLYTQTRDKVYTEIVLRRSMDTPEALDAVRGVYTQFHNKLIASKKDITPLIFERLTKRIVKPADKDVEGVSRTALEKFYDALSSTHDADKTGENSFLGVMQAYDKALLRGTISNTNDAVVVERYHKLLSKSLSEYVNVNYPDQKGRMVDTFLGFRDGHYAVFLLRDTNGRKAGVLSVDFEASVPADALLYDFHEFSAVKSMRNAYSYVVKDLTDQNKVEFKHIKTIDFTGESSDALLPTERPNIALPQDGTNKTNETKPISLSKQIEELKKKRAENAEKSAESAKSGSAINPLGGIDLADIKVKAAPVSGKIAFAAFDAATFGGFTFKVTSLKRIDAQGLAALAG